MEFLFNKEVFIFCNFKVGILNFFCVMYYFFIVDKIFYKEKNFLLLEV